MVQGNDTLKIIMESVKFNHQSIYNYLKFPLKKIYTYIIFKS